jgi:uncharacterized membrane protein
MAIERRDNLMNARELSHQLRNDRSREMTQRRAIVALSLGAAAAMGVVALYQTGIIKRLPEPRCCNLDGAKVNASEEAYARLKSPDALLGLHSYSTTAILAMIGGSNRVARLPWLPVALAGKVLFDVATAAKLTWDQWARHKAFCVWCLFAAACTFGMLPLAFPETRRAIKKLWGKPTWRAEARSLHRTARRIAASAI